MKDTSIYTELRERGWRRALTAAERDELRAWLASHPEDAVDWLAEGALNQTLARLPNAPVTGNFTHRVMAEVRRTPARESRLPGWLAVLRHRPFAWLPRVAVASLALVSGVVVYHYAHPSPQVRLARTIATVSEMASLPNAELWRDFDAIRALDHTPGADKELLTLLR